MSIKNPYKNKAPRIQETEQDPVINFDGIPSPAFDPNVEWLGTHDEAFNRVSGYSGNLNYYPEFDISVYTNSSPAARRTRDQYRGWYNQKLLTREDAKTYEQLNNIPSYTLSGTLNEQDLSYHEGKMDSETERIYLLNYNKQLNIAKMDLDEMNPAEQAIRTNVQQANALQASWSKTHNYKRYGELSNIEKRMFWNTRRFTYEEASQYAADIEAQGKQWTIDHPPKPSDDDCDSYLANVSFFDPISTFKGLGDYLICKTKKIFSDGYDYITNTINNMIQGIYDFIYNYQSLFYITGIALVGGMILLSYLAYKSNPISGIKPTIDYEKQKAKQLAEEKGISQSAALKQVVAQQAALGFTSPIALVGQIASDKLSE